MHNKAQYLITQDGMLNAKRGWRLELMALINILSAHTLGAQVQSLFNLTYLKTRQLDLKATFCSVKAVFVEMLEV